MPRPKPPNPRYHEYIEVKILGHRCWISRQDSDILYGLAGHITGAASKLFRELPEGAQIVKVMIYPKWNTGGRKKKEMPEKIKSEALMRRPA